MLFFTKMDSRFSMAIVMICPLVVLMLSQFAGSESLEYLEEARGSGTHVDACFTSLKNMQINWQINFIGKLMFDAY